LILEKNAFEGLLACWIMPSMPRWLLEAIVGAAQTGPKAGHHHFSEEKERKKKKKTRKRKGKGRIGPFSARPIIKYKRAHPI